MPLLRRRPWQLQSTPDLSQLPPNTEVYQIRFTGEIFTTYDEYFNRWNQYRRRIWACECTGRTSLTYEEALKSERVARSKEDDSMHEEWKKKILTLAHYGTSRADHVVEYAWNILKDIPNLNERIHTEFNLPGHTVPLTFECEVCEIVPKVDEAEQQLVKLRILPSNTEPGAAKIRDQLHTVQWQLCRRDRVAFSKNNFKRFLRESTVRELWTGAPLLVRPELMKKYSIVKEMPEDVVELYRRRLDSSNIQLSKKLQRDQLAEQRRAQRSAQRRGWGEGHEDYKPTIFPADDLDVFRWPELHTRADRPDLEGDWGLPVSNAAPGNSQVSGIDAGSLVVVWNFLVVFGVPLKLYPFTLDDFVAALNCPHPGNELLAEVFASLVFLARSELNRFLIENAKKKLSTAPASGVIGNGDEKAEGAEDEQTGDSKTKTEDSLEASPEVVNSETADPSETLNGNAHDHAGTNGVAQSVKERVSPVLEKHLHELQYWNVFPWASMRNARTLSNPSHRLSSWATAVLGCVLDMLSVVSKDGQEEAKCANFWSIAGKLVGAPDVDDAPETDAPDMNGTTNGASGHRDDAVDFWNPKLTLPVADRVRLARQEDHEAQLNERAHNLAQKEAAKEKEANAQAHTQQAAALPPVSAVSGRLRKRNVAAVYASLNADSDGEVERGDDEYVDELAWAFQDPADADKGNRRTSKRQKLDKTDPASEIDINLKDELHPAPTAEVPALVPTVAAIPSVKPPSATPPPPTPPPTAPTLPPVEESNSTVAPPPLEVMMREITLVERVNLGWRKLDPTDRFELIRFLVEEVAMNSTAVKDYVGLAEDQLTELRKEKIDINKEKKDLAQGWLDFKTREYEEQNAQGTSSNQRGEARGKKGGRGGRGGKSKGDSKATTKKSSVAASFDGSDSSLSPYDGASSSDSDSALFSGTEDGLDETAGEAGGDRASISSLGGRQGSDYEMGSGSEFDGSSSRPTSRQLSVAGNQARKAEDSKARRAAEKTAKAELRERAKQAKEVKKRVDEKKKLEDRERHNNKRERTVDRQMMGWFHVLRARPLGRDRFYNRYWWFDPGFGGGASDYLYENPPPRPWKRGHGTVTNGESEEKQGVQFWGSGRLVVEVVGSEDNVAQLRKGDDDPHCLPAQTWGYYSRPEQINRLLEWLNERGFRESQLRLTIGKMKKEITQTMERRAEDIVSAMSGPDEGETHRVTRADAEAERVQGYINRWAFEVPK